MLFPYRFAISVKFVKKTDWFKFFKTLDDNEGLKYSEKPVVDKELRVSIIEVESALDSSELTEYLSKKGFKLQEIGEGLVPLSEPILPDDKKPTK